MAQDSYPVHLIVALCWHMENGWSAWGQCAAFKNCQNLSPTIAWNNVAVACISVFIQFSVYSKPSISGHFPRSFAWEYELYTKQFDINFGQFNGGLFFFYFYFMHCTQVYWK